MLPLLLTLRIFRSTKVFTIRLDHFESFYLGLALELRFVDSIDPAFKSEVLVDFTFRDGSLPTSSRHFVAKTFVP